MSNKIPFVSTTWTPPPVPVTEDWIPPIRSNVTFVRVPAINRWLPEHFRPKQKWIVSSITTDWVPPIINKVDQ